MTIFQILQIFHALLCPRGYVGYKKDASYEELINYGVINVQICATYCIKCF